MFFLLPKKVSLETKMSPAECRRKLNRELIDYTRKPSLVAASQFLKKHRLENCYFGSSEKSGKVEIFYHRAKKHDGSSAGFFGHIEKTSGGSRITGSIRRTAAVYIAAALWTVITLFIALVLVALKEYSGAACTAAVMLAGLGLMLWEGSAGYIQTYLETFPPMKPKEHELTDSADNSEDTDD